VQDIESGHPWIWRVDDQERVQRTPVTLGVRAGSRVEVMSGVSTGSRVVDVAAAGLKAGQRIRVDQGR